MDQLGKVSEVVRMTTGMRREIMTLNIMRYWAMFAATYL